MKRLIAILAAFLFFISQAPANDWIINSYRFVPAVNPSISYVAVTSNTTAGASFTFSSASTGTADATRKTIVGACSDDNGSPAWSATGITVGGVSATEIADSNNASSNVQCAIYIIDNPTGTTATIVVTWSEAVFATHLNVWAAYNLSSSTATDIGGGFSSTAALISGSLNVSANGIAVGVCAINNGGGSTATWTGLTERGTETTSGNTSSTRADTTSAAGGVPLSVTCDETGSVHTILVTASFR